MICRTAAVALLGAFADGERPTAVGSQDHETLPVRCHYEYADDAARCALVLDAVTDAWAAQVDRLGFHPPMPDADGILDLYLTDDGTYGGAYAAGPYIDEDPDDGRMGCHAYVAFDHQIPDAQISGYVAHEFNHVLQYATDFVEPTLPVWEAVATAAERWTDPDNPLVLGAISDFQADPWIGLLGDATAATSDWSLYEYGAVLWILHLDGVYGVGDGALGVELWDATTQVGWNNEPDALDAYGDVTGDWEVALMELSADRALLGTAFPPAWGADLTTWRFAVAVAAQATGSQLPLTVPLTPGPMPTGVAYAELTALTPGVPVTVEIAEPGELLWGIVVADGAETSWELGTTLTWTPTSDRLLLGFANLGEPDFDGDDVLRSADLSVRMWAGERPADSGGRRGPGPSGCGCASGPVGPSPFAPLLILGLATARRRRG